MRASTILVLALLATGAGGCTIHTQSQPAPQGYNPGQWAPQQPGYGYGMPQQPGFGVPQQPQQPSYDPPPIFRQVNVPALLALQGRVPCAPREVAPGTWATFDCAPFQAMQQVLQYVPMMRFNFLPGGPLPAAVDHRSEGQEGPVKDQGAVGDCTAVSLSTAMDNAVRRMGRQDVVSALHIWSRYGIGIHGQAGDSNVNKSITVERVWQYDPAKACKLSRAPFDTCTTAYGVASGSENFDPALKAEHANADANGSYKLAAVERLTARPANPTEIATVLAGGDDVWISFSVNDEAWKSRALVNAVIPDYETVEDVGHAVVLAGYRTLPNGTKQFLVHNSWGPRWGEGGYGWISEAMVAKYTRAAYKVRVTDGAGNAPAAPGLTPVANGCPDGQTKDPLFGACIPGGTPGGIPGLPGILPGFPGTQPAQPAQPAQPTQPAQPAQPKQQQGSCPQGQAADLLTRQCANLCPSGTPSAGGMCVPALPR